MNEPPSQSPPPSLSAKAPPIDPAPIRSQWRLSREAIRAVQLKRLNALLKTAVQRDFYRQRLATLKLPLESLDQLGEIPLLTKPELVAPSPGVPGRIFNLPKAAYTRFHQTSGTSGHPMPVLDTPGDWNWWLDCWSHVLHAAEVSASDVALMAFSFGPFIGFWTAADALVQAGALVIPGGGMSSQMRLQMMIDHHCTVVCCTPTYALHLIAVADELSIDLRNTSVTRLIVAGEPGGSEPTIRSRIEDGMECNRHRPQWCQRNRRLGIRQPGRTRATRHRNGVHCRTFVL